MTVPVVFIRSFSPPVITDAAAAPEATPCSCFPWDSNCFILVKAMGIDGDRRLYWEVK